jgi:hypothetical protein
MSDHADRLYAWLLKRSAGSSSRKMRAAGLLPSAVAALGLDVVDARTAFRMLRIDERVEYTPDISGLPYTGYLQVKVPAVVEPLSLTRWKQALSADEIEQGLHDALLPAHETLADLGDDDLALLVAGLVRVRATARHEPCTFGFALSARELLGSSKLLDRMPLAARRLLGVAELPSTPRYLVAAGPARPEGVLLIENSTTFEDAVRAGFHTDMLLIAAYGYGLNLMTDSASGWALVDSITSGRCEVLRRSGQDFDLPALLHHPRLHFWGDLDREGLRIALALRSRLPQLTLSALYEPMRSLVASPAHSHPYSIACGKANQLPWQTCGDSTIDALAALCAVRAVDQEAIDLQANIARCCKPLESA